MDNSNALACNMPKFFCVVGTIEVTDDDNNDDDLRCFIRRK